MSEIIEAMAKVFEGGIGFRYLFSKSFREKTRQRWRKQSKISITFEILEATIGVAFIVVILLVLLGVVR